MAKSKTTAGDEKPKKILTEAQRLAFLKGREKRMANLEMKRQAQQEQQLAEESPITDSPDEDYEPIQEELVPEPPVLKRQTNHIEQTPLPSEPVLDATKPIETDNPSTSPSLVVDDDAMARKIADYVFDRLQLEVPEPMPAPVSPKKKKRVSIAPKPTPSTQTPSVAIPQRTFAWA